MKIVKIICIFFLSFIPLALFGHVANNFFNWNIAYPFLGIGYAALGYTHKISRVPRHEFFMTVGVSWFLFWSIAYLEESELFSVLGLSVVGTTVLGYLSGYLLYDKKFISMYVFLGMICACFLFSYFYLPKYFYDLSVSYSYAPKDYLLTKPVLKFTDLKGRFFPKENFKDKVVLLDFWFVECEPCVRKLAYLQKLHEHFANRNDVVIATVVSGNANTRKEISDFLEKKPHSFLVLYDSSNVFLSKYKIGNRGLPEEITIDKTGKIVATLSGFEKAIEPTYFKSSIDNIENILQK